MSLPIKVHNAEEIQIVIHLILSSQELIHLFFRVIASTLTPLSITIHEVLVLKKKALNRLMVRQALLMPPDPKVVVHDLRWRPVNAPHTTLVKLVYLVTKGIKPIMPLQKLMALPLLRPLGFLRRR